MSHIRDVEIGMPESKLSGANRFHHRGLPHPPSLGHWVHSGANSNKATGIPLDPPSWRLIQAMMTESTGYKESTFVL